MNKILLKILHINLMLTHRSSQLSSKNLAHYFWLLTDAAERLSSCTTRHNEIRGNVAVLYCLAVQYSFYFLC